MESASSSPHHQPSLLCWAKICSFARSMARCTSSRAASMRPNFTADCEVLPEAGPPPDCGLSDTLMRTRCFPGIFWRTTLKLTLERRVRPEWPAQSQAADQTAHSPASLRLLRPSQSPWSEDTRPRPLPAPRGQRRQQLRPLWSRLPATPGELPWSYRSDSPGYPGSGKLPPDGLSLSCYSIPPPAPDLPDAPHS